MEFYPALRHLHISTAVISITLFALRLALSLNRPYPSLPRWLRVVPHLNDTVLLSAAVMLALLSQQYPLQQAWLTAKLAALLVYIGLGTVALKRARSVPARLCWGLAALTSVAYIVLVARSRSIDLGLF